MKKLLIILLCLLTLCACGEKDSGTMVIEEGEEPEWLAGGWCVNPDLPVINDAYFDAATKELGYSPLLLLGSQVVAGRNYIYLAYNAVTSYSVENAYKMIRVYVDLDGNAQLSSETDFNLTDYLEANDNTTPDDLMGGYTDNAELENQIGDELSEMFALATKDIANITYTPICLLASQVVAGTNYAILAKGTDAEEATHLYIFNIYQSLDGSTTINNISGLNISLF